ncbi:hypothetical protein J3E69DRAFT_336496 [Trichoderma sp. SZMC 28015]
MVHKLSTRDATASNDRFRSIRTTCSYLAAGCLSTIAFCMTISQLTEQAVDAYSWKAYRDYMPVRLYSFIEGLDDYEIYGLLSLATLWLCLLCLRELLGETRCHSGYALAIAVATIITFALSTDFIQGDPIKINQFFIIIIYAYTFIGHIVDIHLNWHPRRAVEEDLLASDKC